MNMKILHFYFLLRLLLKCHCETKIRPNILIIIVDDLRHLLEDKVKLKYIDKMAANGIDFKNAYAQQALCAPSRNSMLTGRRPDTIRLYDFYNYWRDTVGNFTTLPQFFRENGYDTYSVGKIFHPGESCNFTDDYPYSWSHHPYHPSTEKYKDEAVCKDSITNKFQRNLICPVNIELQPEKTLPDLQSLDYAINVLENKKNNSKPFLLAVGFHKPHIPLKFPEEYLDLERCVGLRIREWIGKWALVSLTHSPKHNSTRAVISRWSFVRRWLLPPDGLPKNINRIPLKKVHPPRFPNMPHKMPLVSWHPWTDVRQRDDIERLNVSFPFGTIPNQWAMKIKQSYYAASIYVDDLIGALISRVNLNNTIVVMTSDHGWSLGENGMWAKYSNFDVALKVPLIFNIPTFQPKAITTPVELVDIFPTLADLAGLADTIPQCECNDKSNLCFEGKSLLSLIEGKAQKPYKKFSLSQCPRPSVYPKKNSDKPRLKDIKIMGYSVRTKRYRYTEWISFNSTSFTRDWSKNYGTELYDHVTDPEESHNVHFKTKYKRMKHYLSKLLRSQVEPHCIF